MKNQVKFSDYLLGRKRVIWGINLFEIILFSLAIITSIVIIALELNKVNFNNINSYVLASQIITLIDLPLGIVAAIALSRKWKWSWLLLSIDAVLYGSASLLTGNFSLGIINLLTPFIFSLTLITWKDFINENDEAQIKTRKLGILEGISLVISIIGLSILLGYGVTSLKQVISNDDGNYFISSLFDASAGILMLFAALMSVFRYRETWYLYLFSNTIKIIFFSLLISQGNYENILLLVIAITYFINAIYGNIIWWFSKKEHLIKKDQ